MRGQELASWPAQALQRPETAADAPAKRRLGNGVYYLLFSASQDNHVIGIGWLPPEYKGHGVTFVAHVAPDTNVSGATDTVKCTLELERGEVDVLDTDSDNWDTAKTWDMEIAGGPTDYQQFTLDISDGADLDNIVAKELFRFRFTRDADHASDDAPRMRLVGISMEEQNP